MPGPTQVVGERSQRPLSSASEQGLGTVTILEHRDRHYEAPEILSAPVVTENAFLSSAGVVYICITPNMASGFTASVRP